MIARLLRFAPLAVLLLLTACRTYGGYESEEIMRQQMLEANQQFSDDLERARADLAVLQRAAGEATQLQPFVERFRSNIEAHESTLESHRQIAQDLEGSSDYRKLHRAYGTITTEQRIVNKQYNRTVNRIHAAVTNQEVQRGESYNQSFYYVEPLAYAQIENARKMTMEEAVRGEE